MPIIFKVRKSKGFGILLIIASLVVLGVVFIFPYTYGTLNSIGAIFWSSLGSSLFIGFFTWTWFNTSYTIRENQIVVQWGPARWKVPISEIRLIRKDQDTYAGITKPTLCWKCIEIQYRKYRSICISPVEEEKFILMLLERNPDIRVKD